MSTRFLWVISLLFLLGCSGEAFSERPTGLGFSGSPTAGSSAAAAGAAGATTSEGGSSPMAGTGGSLSGAGGVAAAATAGGAAGDGGSSAGMAGSNAGSAGAPAGAGGLGGGAGIAGMPTAGTGGGGAGTGGSTCGAKDDYVCTVSTARSLTTGLVWRRDWKGATYQQALIVCDDLGAPWRVPTANELKSLIVLDQGMHAIDLEVFPDTGFEAFWSTDVGSIANTHVTVHYLNQPVMIAPGLDSGMGAVRCVRDP